MVASGFWGQSGSGVRAPVMVGYTIRASVFSMVDFGNRATENTDGTHQFRLSAARIISNG
jgi:hypothetical protein